MNLELHLKSTPETLNDLHK